MVINMEYFDIAAFIVIVLTVNVVFVMSHETIHQRIMDYDGCANPVITYHVFADSYTNCNSINYHQTKEAFVLHSWNEILGYNLGIFINLIFIIVIFFKMEDWKQ